MNFKIENRIIHISNYPSVERHLEDMARRGWMIDKVIFSHIFIYKRADPRELDFSIAPYESETFFNKKNKEDIERYKNRNKDLGWEYISKALNFQIYFKEKDQEIKNIISSPREELSILEDVGKTQRRSHYVMFPFLFFYFFNLLKDLSGDIRFLKSGLGQILIVVLPIFFLIGVIDIISINKFLKLNRRNISQGENFAGEGANLEYSHSKFYMHKMGYLLSYLLLILFIAYILFKAIIAKETVIIIALIPVIIGSLVGIGFRFFVKPSKKIGEYKVPIFIVAIIATIILVNLLVAPIMFDSVDSSWKKKEDVNINEDKVLIIEDFYDGNKTDSANLSRDISFLIPKSFDFTARSKDRIYIRTEYSNAITEGVAKNLVNRYKARMEYRIENWRSFDLEEYYHSKTTYGDGIFDWGITEEDLDKIRDKDIEEYKEVAREIMKDRTITKADTDLWDVDEAYFLDYNKEEIVLRKGSEVYWLNGVDFSDEEVVRTAKDKLGL